MLLLHLPDVSIGSRTYLFENIKSSMDVVLNIARLILIAHLLNSEVLFNFI